LISKPFNYAASLLILEVAIKFALRNYNY